MTTFVQQMLSNKNTQDLVLELQNGSEAALSQLYDRYSEALYGLVLRILRDELLAQDVLQESFVNIWKKADTYSSKKGTFFTWSMNICRNKAIDELRKRGRKTEVQEELSAEEGSGFSPAQNIEGIGIKDLLSDLPEDQEDVLHLMYFRGYTQQEISDEYSIPLGTVKTRARSGLKKLKELFILLVLLWILKNI
jgi:RNA polymerase sigma-70 factor (ECF subfamily)